MAHIVDVRGSGGEFVVLGDALTLPGSDAGNSSLPASLLYNPVSGTIEALLPKDASRDWEQFATVSGTLDTFLPLTGGTLSDSLVVQGNVTATGTVKAGSFDGTATSAIYGADLAERSPSSSSALS